MRESHGGHHKFAKAETTTLLIIIKEKGGGAGQKIWLVAYLLQWQQMCLQFLFLCLK